MIFATTPTTNEKEGNGKYRPLRKRKVQKTQEQIDAEFSYLSTTNSRMRLNNSKDPIYFAFKFIENRSFILEKNF